MSRTTQAFDSWHRGLRPSARWPIFIGAFAILLGLGGGGFWAATAPLDSAAVAPGVVVAAGQNKVIQHLEGGIVEEILVSEGETVVAGQILIRMSKTAAEAAHRSLLIQLDELRAVEARLVAERDGHAAVEFPADLLGRHSDTEVARIIDGQRSEFAARRESLSSEVSIHEARILALREEIGGLDIQRKSTTDQLTLIKEELADSKKLLEQGLMQKPRVLALERNATELSGNQGELTATIAKAEQNILAARAQISTLKKDWLEKLIAQLRDVQFKIADVGERLNAASDVAARTEIRSPVAGIVIKLNVNTIGGVVRPGDLLLELLPTGAGLLIEARVDPDDIDIVFPGSTAQLRFPALRARLTPTFEGRVEFVSADRLVDRETQHAYYLARVRMSADDISGLKLYPGMPAEVFVEAGERTVLEYLAGPLSDAIAHSWREQ
jgi:HlyD family type I secretion membrane fusion protein